VFISISLETNAQCITLYSGLFIRMIKILNEPDVLYIILYDTLDRVDQHLLIYIKFFIHFALSYQILQKLLVLIK
jgi:hypothetical protein